MTEAGISGLRISRGVVDDEWLPELKGKRGMAVLAEMRDNDPIIGGAAMAIEMLLRKVSWEVVPYDAENPADHDAAEFLRTCMYDMSHTWEDFISEALTKIHFGWALCEIVYKRREGPDGEHRSEHDDGRYGWRKLPLRAQDTLDRWEFDDEGGIQAMIQTGTDGKPRVVPIEKAVLFRTTTRKNNPEGRTLWRNAYLPWWRKKRIEQAEAIGVERDLAGLPIAGLPPELFDPDAPAGDKAALAEWKKIMTQVRRDEQACIVYPMIYDENGNRLVEVSLLSSGGARQFDTSKIIERYSRQIAMSVLADVIMMGHEAVGSLALASQKQELFTATLKAQVEEIASVLNRYAVPRLWELNGWDPATRPEIVPSGVDQIDLADFVGIIKTLADSGMPMFPDVDLEDAVRSRVGLPARPEFFDDDGEAFAGSPAIGREDDDEDDGDAG
jgi:hypothetical protein